MSRNLVGEYVAEVGDVALASVGKDGQYPVIELTFLVKEKLNGVRWEECESASIKKLLFLSTDPIKSGKNEGKSGVEKTREDLLDVFGYEGRLDENELKGQIIGKKARLLCIIKEEAGRVYNQVKYMNKYAGVARERTRKPIDPALLSKLDNLFSKGTNNQDGIAWPRA